MANRADLLAKLFAALDRGRHILGMSRFVEGGAHHCKPAFALEVFLRHFRTFDQPVLRKMDDQENAQIESILNVVLSQWTPEFNAGRLSPNEMQHFLEEYRRLTGFGPD